MTLPSSDPAAPFLAELERRLADPHLGHVELTAGPVGAAVAGGADGGAAGGGAVSGDVSVRLRIDAVAAGQTFYWITFIAATDAEFEVAFTAKAAMRSFPWTMPFRPKLERKQATLPALCRWQRAYVEDTAALGLFLLTKHFRVPLDSVRVSGGEVEGGSVKSQKAWLGEITAWYMSSRG
jgi:hypothetical protein